MKKIISYFCSFEVVFLLFLRYAEFESVAVFSAINEVVSLITFFWIINIVQSIYIVYYKATTKKYKINVKSLIYFSIFIVLLLYILCSYILTPDDPKSNRKMLEFATIISWCMFSGIFIINTYERARRFILAAIIFAIIVSLSALNEFVTGGVGIRQLTGGLSESYHRLGRSAGALVVISLVTLPYANAIWKKTGLGLTLIVALAGLVSSGQRAPWVAFPTTLIALFFQTYKDRAKTNGILRKYLVTGGLILTVLIGGTLTFTQRGQYIVERFETIGLESSNSTRLYMYEESINRYAGNPVFGVGFGRFSRETGLYIWRHPHNLFIEVLLELGVVGLTLVLFIIFGWIYPYYSNVKRNNWSIVVLTAMFWFYLTNAMISGSITDNRVLLSISAILFSVLLSSEDN